MHSDEYRPGTWRISPARAVRRSDPKCPIRSRFRGARSTTCRAWHGPAAGARLHALLGQIDAVSLVHCLIKYPLRGIEQ